MRSTLCFLFLTLVLLATSQTKSFVGFKVGGLGTTSYMNHSILPIVMKIKWRSGMTGGVQFIHFSEKFDSKVNFGFQTGLNFSQKGWTQRFKGVDNHKTRINYMELPFEAIGYAGNATKFYATAGFYVEYAVSAKSDPIPESAQVNEDYPELYVVGKELSAFHRYDFETDNRLNYGPRGSIGLFRETKSGMIKVETFFTFSIRGTYDFEPYESGIPDQALNYTVGATIGYYFKFGKLEI